VLPPAVNRLKELMKRALKKSLALLITQISKRLHRFVFNAFLIGAIVRNHCNQRFWTFFRNLMKKTDRNDLGNERYRAKEWLLKRSSDGDDRQREAEGVREQTIDDWSNAAGA